MMNEGREIPVNWFVWLQWVLASGIGGAAVFPLVAAAGGFLSGVLYRAIAEVVIFGLFWAGMSTMQWLLLRNYIPQSGWWVAASTVGGTLIGIGAVSLGGNGNVNPIIAYILMGVIIGVLQWLVLSRHISQSVWWVVASPVGWALAWLAVMSPLARLGQNLMNRVSEILGIMFVLGLMGAVAGMVTGGLLVWLLRQSFGSVIDTGGQKPA
jgi:hypothetical protein